MTVDIEELQEIFDRLKEINSKDIKEIEFIKDGKKIEISDKILEDFKFTGLINTDIIKTEFYINGFDE